MNTTTFLFLLAGFTTINALVVEAVKKIFNEKEHFAYNIVALISALIVGGIGTLIYYQLNDIPFTTNNIVYAILMGLASGLSSMVTFDKVKQALIQCGFIKEK